MKWCCRHTWLGISSIAIVLLVSAFVGELQRIEAFRFGAHIDGVAILVTLAGSLALMSPAL